MSAFPNHEVVIIKYNQEKTIIGLLATINGNIMTLFVRDF